MVEKLQICEHLISVEKLKFAQKHECSECIETGDHWVHLRTCQSCGKTLCCDSSPNQHMSKHAADENHPVAISSEPGEQWMWCYIDNQAASY